MQDSAAYLIISTQCLTKHKDKDMYNKNFKADITNDRVSKHEDAVRRVPKLLTNSNSRKLPIQRVKRLTGDMLFLSILTEAELKTHHSSHYHWLLVGMHNTTTIINYHRNITADIQQVKFH